MVGIGLFPQSNPHKQTEFVQAFEILKSTDVHDDSRLSLTLFNQVDDPSVFLWVEHWRDRMSLESNEDNQYRGMPGELLYKHTFILEYEKQDDK